MHAVLRVLKTDGSLAKWDVQELYESKLVSEYPTFIAQGLPGEELGRFAGVKTAPEMRAWLRSFEK